MREHPPIVTEEPNKKYHPVTAFGPNHPPYECNNIYCKDCGKGSPKKPSEERKEWNDFYRLCGICKVNERDTENGLTICASCRKEQEEKKHEV